MSRPLRLVAVLVVAGVAACDNSYQFAPAGHCILQPGSVQVRLDPTSSADILFVVDDSPSTNEKQAGLAAKEGASAVIVDAEGRIAVSPSLAGRIRWSDRGRTTPASVRAHGGERRGSPP